MVDKVNEEGQLVDDSGKAILDESGKPKHPEFVPWTQYVGIKEKFNRVETELKTKVTTLEEQLKATVSTDELTKIKGELTTTKAELEKVSTELKNFKESSITEKKKTLEAMGVPKDKLEGLTEKELTNLHGVLGVVKGKPAPDLSSGGGDSGGLKGSPLELARQAYSMSNK